MQYQRLVPHAQAPQASAIGYDIFSAEGYAIMPGDRVVVSTGLKVKLPPGYYGVLLPKTGITIKHGVSVSGTLDSTYDGELKVVIFNHDRKNTFVIRPGYRVAELVLQPVASLESTEIAPDN